MSYTYSCTFYPWTVNESHSLCHATWGMRCVRIFDSQQSLLGYCGRLVGLVKMQVRKCRVTDVAFLLSHTNMVILPLPCASLILHTHTRIHALQFRQFSRHVRTLVALRLFQLLQLVITSRQRYAAYSNVSGLHCGNFSEVLTVYSFNSWENKQWSWRIPLEWLTY